MSSPPTRDAKGVTPASLMLDYIPSSQRLDFLKSSIDSLQPENPSNVDFVASLVQHSGHPTAGCAVSISLQHVDMGKALLTRASQYISQARSISDTSQLEGGALQFYLQFSKLTASHLSTSSHEIQRLLFQACLALLSSTRPRVSCSARDVVFELLASRNGSTTTDVIQPSRETTWQRVQTLLASQAKHHTLIGYSLWLRWILSDPGEHWKQIATDDYWQLIFQGLRRGDTERRKLCLNILRLSLGIDTAAVPKDLQQQYERYITVFETIVLGRYINQIQECESDLNQLAASSDLHSQWLFTLLACAMDSVMQDSTRKFIGNWVMRSVLSLTPEMLEFFRDSILPWATQGHLFVSSLKTAHGRLQCLHGELLAGYIQSLRRESERSLVVDVVADTIIQRRHSMFAYCTVYLLEGLGDSLDESHASRLSELPKLPEVAQDYIQLKIPQTTQVNVTKTNLSQRDLQDDSVFHRIRLLCKQKAGMGDLEAVWEDMESIEFPKRLLMLMTDLISHPSIIRSALLSPMSTAYLQEKVHTLQQLAGTKMYLFAPLVTAVRTAVVGNPSAVGVMGLEDFLVGIAEHPPEPTVEFMLEEATAHLTPHSYEHYFGDRPSLGFAAYLDLVSRLRDHQDLVQAIMNRVFEPWRAQKGPVPSVSPWKNKLQLQVLLLCLEQYDAASEAEVHKLLEDLFHVLALEPLPSLRYLLEWITVRLIMRYDLAESLIARLKTKDHHSNPKHLASLMKIGAILACTPDSGEDFAMQLATTFVPLAASSKVVVRHEAQWQVPVLMDHARNQGWVSIAENTVLAALDDYIRSLERFHDPPLERLHGRFDPVTDHTLTNLAEGKWFELDQMEAPLTSHEDFSTLYSKHDVSEAPASCVPLGPKIERSTPQLEAAPNATKAKAAVSLLTPEHSTALQTKGTAYLARTLSPVSPTRPQNLIVVASLVDNPHNLGGLSRVSEIFGASTLTLQNQNVVSNKDFASVSVSSHLHFPIVQLSSSGIPEYLRERKREGFVVVGIEQTDRSVLLGSEESVLPEKCVLVVGSEREGIPATVLVECDVLVEIPQRGVTRSLNVQTAVAVVLFEYERQFGKRR
ncbi:hypothetical protein LTR37_015595 [Vermiconidia calcicola]|uniref:Uncharacterized protein n=1 Tax=Vermiconidia calcicola TaxID=1690605 RepID=A0ACC3MRW0_9PEZI|nr:hypothetical protein LTR37_015595 [Vermiconidia calcicola]